MPDKDMFTAGMRKKCEDLLVACKKCKLKLATAESCTGGAIAALITEIPGCSSAFERGFITYSNEAKTEMLGVDKALIDTHGAVSEQVAVAMARGALEHSNANIAVSVTGIAGPDGGSEEKPVGMVCIAVATNDGVDVKTHRFSGDRGRIRMDSVSAALDMLVAKLKRSSFAA